VKYIRWLIIAALCTAAPASAFWQSRDSNYNKSVASSAYSGPGDIVSATMWYGLRAYSSAKVGTKIANICNAADANCADINSLSNGDFDAATAQGSPLNCGGVGGTCTIKTLYDQSGALACTGSTACDVTQATILSRPTISFSCLGSKVCAVFVAASSMVLKKTSSVPTFSQPFSFSIVAVRTGTVTSYNEILVSSGGGPEFGNSANQLGAYFGAHANVSAADSTWHAEGALANGASSAFYIDGTNHAVSAGSTGFGTTINIGLSSGGALGLDGKFEEGGFWSSDISANFSALNSNQHTYWGF
jgi:hypothetical protein